MGLVICFVVFTKARKVASAGLEYFEILVIRNANRSLCDVFELIACFCGGLHRETMTEFKKHLTESCVGLESGLAWGGLGGLELASSVVDEGLVV